MHYSSMKLDTSKFEDDKGFNDNESKNVELRYWISKDNRKKCKLILRENRMLKFDKTKFLSDMFRQQLESIDKDIKDTNSAYIWESSPEGVDNFKPISDKLLLKLLEVKFRQKQNEFQIILDKEKEENSKISSKEAKSRINHLFKDPEIKFVSTYIKQTNGKSNIPEYAMSKVIGSFGSESLKRYLKDKKNGFSKGCKSFQGRYTD